MNRQHPSMTAAAANTIAFIGVIVVNTLANTLPINGLTTGSISDNYPNLFVPAGITFSIWGVIYLLLAVFTVHQLTAALQKKPSRSIEAVGILFVLSSLANIAWILTWHYLLISWSVVIMLVLFLSLAALYSRLYILRPAAGPVDKWCVHLPFSIYFGWITVAAIANITALLTSVGWNGFGLSDQFWAAALVITAAGIGLFVLFGRNDAFFSLVIVWALAGIFIKRQAEQGTADQAVTIAAAAGAAIVAVGIIIQLIRRKAYA